MDLTLVIVTVMAAITFGRVGSTVLASDALADTGIHAAPLLENPDQLCAGCHREIYDRYKRTPMASGSGLAIDGLSSDELAAGRFTHLPSGVTYGVYKREGRAWMSYNREGQGGPALHGTQELAYYIGSGHRGRTYLFQHGQLWFETPINWYGKKKVWDMAPNYGLTKTMPYTLLIDANCLHCHAGEVQASLPGARNRFAGQPFKSGGVGCASCHGDPSAHLSAHGGGAILNPSKMPPANRDSACLQCHLEGDVAVYRAGKSLAMYKPGDDLNDYAVYFINASRDQLGGRATSQYEALLLSACKRASGDKMTCTTCHDPHSSPSPQERVAFFRSRCIACHSSPAIATQHHPEQQNCAACHMPTRKTEDISHEQLTDHHIEKLPSSAVTIEENAAIRLVAVGNAKAGDRELGLAYAQMAQHGNKDAAKKALALLVAAEKGGADDSEVHEQLGFLKQISGDVDGAAKEYSAVLQQLPQDVTAAANLAVLEAARGHVKDAMRLLGDVLHTDPARTTAGLNLAFLQCELGDKVTARRTIESVLEFNPDNAEARRFHDSGYYSGRKCDLR